MRTRSMDNFRDPAILFFVFGLSAGDGGLLMVLAASASYIAVPAVVRMHSRGQSVLVHRHVPGADLPV